MNKKADFNLQGMLIGILVVGLFVGIVAFIIGALGDGYDTTGYDMTDIEKYSVMRNISEVVSETSSDIDKAAVDPGWFDFISGIFNKILTPFKFLYRSASIIKGLTSSAVDDLQLPSIFIEFFITLFTILVVIGIVMMKIYMGRNK